MESVAKSKKIIWAAGILLAGLITFKLISIITGADSKRANVLLITLDTLRLDHLNTYGYERDTSPSLDELAKDSFVFDQAFTVATTSAPSHATLLTGLYPAQHGLLDNGQEINDETRTLAEILSQTGYDTAGFVGYYALAEESGLDKGFQNFEYHPIVSHDHDEKEPEDDVKGFAAVNEWLESWAQSSEDSRAPFFVWMHVQNIHESYDPPPPYNTMFQKISGLQTFEGFKGEFDVHCANDLADAWRANILPPHFKDEAIALYDGEIRFVDDQLGRIFARLKSMKAYDDTVIVVVSDHGEILFELYENDFYKKGPGHTARYTDASIRVPLILKPEKFQGFENTGHLGQMVSSVDLVPTLLELLGFQSHKNLPGESLVPIMRQVDFAMKREKIFVHEVPDEVEYFGVRTDQLKFVTKNEKGIESSLLIDLVNDPEENRSELSSLKAQEMKELLGEWKKENQYSIQTREMTEAMRKALKEGGYLRE
jgi:arylsulfatase A-like enzyme